MATNVADDQLEHLIMCAVCLETLKSPKMLYCGHTFCKICLTSIVAKSRKRDVLCCPECRAEHKVPLQGIDGFPDNRTAAAFVELYAAKTPGGLPNAGMHCLECGRTTQTHKCDHCGKSVCNDCLEFHASQLLHETKRLADIFKKEVDVVSRRFYETKEAYTQQLKKSCDEAQTMVKEFTERGIEALKAVQDEWIKEIALAYETESESFGAKEEELEIKIVQILSQLDAASNPSSDTKPDIGSLLELNKECRKRIGQIGDLKEYVNSETRSTSGDSKFKSNPRRVEFQHVKAETFTKNFKGLGKIKVSSPPDQSSKLNSDSSITYKSSRAAKCYDVLPDYFNRRQLLYFGKAGEEFGELLFPWGVAVNKDDEIIVADDENARVHFFSHDGQAARIFHASHDGSHNFKYISGLLVDDNNTVIVSEESSAKLHFYTAGGEVEKTVDLVNGEKPRGIAMDLAENLYIADIKNHCVLKYNSNGELLNTYGLKGSNVGQFIQPSFLALTPDEEKLIVSDTGNNRIQILSAKTGDFILSFGTKGKYDCEFDGPCGVVVDQAGNILVVDSNNNRIQVFNMQGQFVTEISLPWFLEPLDNPGGFRDLALLKDGKMVLTDHLNHRVIVL